MKKIVNYLVLLLSLSLITSVSYATHVIQNTLAIAANISSLVSGVCFVIGVGLLGGALIQYRQHRRNRLMTPISKPIFMLILGIILVCIPILGHYFAPGGEILAHQTY